MTGTTAAARGGLDDRPPPADDPAMVDLKLLKSFLALTKHRHFGRAAQELHATQPGVSQHIAKLESQLGFALLTRRKKAVELTPAGTAVAARAAQIMSALDGLVAEGRQIDAGRAGSLALGLSSSALFSEALQSIRRFRRDNPQIALRVSVHPADTLAGMLDTGAVEVALTTLPSAWEGRHARHVTFQDMGLALAVGDDRHAAAAIRLAELAGEPFIVVPRDMHPTMHDALVAYFAGIGATVRIAAHEVAFPSVFARVAIGEGVGLVPLCLAASAPAGVRVCRLVDNPLPPIELRAVTGSGIASPSLTRFLDHLSGDDSL